MKLVAYICAAISVALPSFALSVSNPNPVAANNEEQVYPIAPDDRIPIVDCEKTRGSAVRIGPNLLVSAHHVTSADGCTINGKPFKILYASRQKDFSLLRLEGDGFVPIDCGGFKDGRDYIAIGHARGLNELMAVRLVGTGRHESRNGLAILKGIATVIPGQSGGPVIDRETRAVVGIVNIYDSPGGLSGSREMRDMGVCGSA